MIKVGDSIRLLEDTQGFIAYNILTVTDIDKTGNITAETYNWGAYFSPCDEGTVFEVVPSFNPQSIQFTPTASYTSFASELYEISRLMSEIGQPKICVAPVCECGAEKVNSQRHSTWCSKYNNL